MNGVIPAAISNPAAARQRDRRRAGCGHHAHDTTIKPAAELVAQILDSPARSSKPVAIRCGTAGGYLRRSSAWP